MSSLFIFLFVYVLIWIAPVVAGVIIAKKKNRSPHWFWFGIIPGAGFWVLVVMLFLPPLAICENCKQKIPADAKICPFCETKTSFSTRTPEEIQAAKKRHKKILWISVAAIVAISFAMVFGIFGSISASFKTCEPYKHSLELIENNADAKEYLGDKYAQTGGISGSLKTNANGTGSAVISYRLKGKNGISVVYVDAEKENGVWIYKKVIFYKTPNSTDSINLLSDIDINQSGVIL